ncbi:MAG: Wzy polymerase domain-containing protein [Candidatus Neomarinimicrobiota bacterium]|nr:Wzy polymerase domain-containing protein [Candidatus Neomarinimicrobiota bacterium]
MVQKIPDLNLKNLFKTIFALYMLAGMHFNMEHVGGYGLYLPFNIIGWMFLSLLIGLGFWQIGKTGKILFSQFHCLCWIGFGLMCLPLLYPNNEYADFAVMRLLGLSGGLLLFLSFQQYHFTREERYWFLYVILGSVLIQILLAVSGSLLLSINFLGITLDPSFGALAQKNIFSTFIATGAVISLFLLLNHQSAIHSNFKLGIIFSVPFLVCTQIYSLQSRTGTLALAFGIGFMLVFGFQKNKKIFLWIGSALIGLLIGFKTPYESRPAKALDYSENTRMLTYQLTTELIKNNPLFGIGYGNFLSAFRLHYAKRKQEEPSLKTIGNSNMDHPHNETMFWMVEGGIIPLAGLLIIAGGFLIMLWKIKKNEAWVMAGLVIPILIHTQLELPFYLSLIHWFIFIFLLYFMDEEYGILHEAKIQLPVFICIIALLLPIIIIYYMATTLQTAKAITRFERTGFSKPSLLVTVKNPRAWQKKYETIVMKLDLRIAKQTKDYKKLKDYIDWAENYVKHSPYLFIYYDLATAYQAMGDKEKAWEVYRYAQYLYPGAKWRDETDSKDN